ncbi:hypothetical protein PFISCL1PPCAC_15924, partial [Pristionchus fissidentatus]
TEPHISTMSKVLPVPKVLPSGKIVKKSKTSRRSQNIAGSQFTREEREEMRRLSAMLPMPARRVDKHEQDPSVLLNDTVCYINHLVATVQARVAAGSLPREVLAQLDPRFASVSPSSSTSTSPSSSPTRVVAAAAAGKRKRRSPKH